MPAVVTSSAARASADITLVLISSSRAPDFATFVLTPDGGRVRRVTGYVYEPLVSPDRRWMLVSDSGDRAVLMRTDGTRLFHLTSRLPLVEGAWAPDGSRVAYFDGAGRLRILDLQARLLLTNDALTAQPPAWNDDGRLLAGLSGTFNSEKHTRDVVLVDSVTGQSRVVAADADLASRLAWRPGTSTLAYETAGGSVALLDVANGRRVMLKTTQPPYRMLWSYDGNLLTITTLQSTAEVIDAKGAPVRTLRIDDSWSVQWVGPARLAYLQRGVGVVTTDVRSGQTTVVVPETNRRIRRFEWSPDRSAFAVQRERFRGYGSDVVVVDTTGHESRTTSPYPDGGDNELVGWAAGSVPPRRPPPAHLRPVALKVAAHVPLAAWLFQSRPSPVYAALEPANDDRTAAIGCGPLFVHGLRSFDVCSGKPIVDAAATGIAYAWVIEHPDEGIGDEDTECAYIVARRVDAPAPGGGSCPANPKRHPGFVSSAFGGSVDLIAADGTLLVARTYYGGLGTDTIERWDGRRLRLVVRGKAEGLSLVDADAAHLLVRRGPRLEVLSASGRRRASRLVGRRYLDARLDGDHVVVLRRDVIELHSLALRLEQRRRLAPAWAEPTLCGARGLVAAYVEGVVPRVISFRTGRDIGFRIRGAAPPFSCGIRGGELLLAFQREGADPAGVVATIGLDAASR